MLSKELKEVNLDYIDGITVIDHTGKILYSLRYNPRFDKEHGQHEFDNIINKNILEAFPSLTDENSTMMRCLREGEPIYKDHQVFHDYKNRKLNTQNLTLPIIKRGKVVGAIELVKDITTIEDLSFLNADGPLKKVADKQCVLQYAFDDIITNSDVMIKNIEKAKLISDSSSSVLIYGETGSGKELFVQAIHQLSPRQNKAFVAQNCAALPETLFESILFGTVKGAFTGAETKKGLFEIANGGTLFLDEINSMPVNLQAKLLRVIQDGFVRRIGDTKDIKVDVRIIAAMNVEPRVAMIDNKIRKDLFYRLNVNSLKLPALRERKCDINLLTSYFIDKYNTLLSKEVKGVSKDVKLLFSLYNWPGNVRELQHVIEGAMNFVSKGKLDIGHLPAYLSESLDDLSSQLDSENIQPLNDMVEIIEKKMIKKAVKKAGGNISKAAKYLEISRQNLQYKINKYQMSFEE